MTPTKEEATLEAGEMAKQYGQFIRSLMKNQNWDYFSQTKKQELLDKKLEQARQRVKSEMRRHALSPQ